MNLLVIVFVVLLVLKLTGTSDISWFWVMSPIFVGALSWIFVFLCTLAVVVYKEYSAEGIGDTDSTDDLDSINNKYK